MTTIDKSGDLKSPVTPPIVERKNGSRSETISQKVSITDLVVGPPVALYLQWSPKELNASYSHGGEKADCE